MIPYPIVPLGPDSKVVHYTTSQPEDCYQWLVLWGERYNFVHFNFYGQIKVAHHHDYDVREVTIRNRSYGAFVPRIRSAAKRPQQPPNRT